MVEKTRSLSQNQLTELPPQIETLTKLRILYLNNNQLTTIPAGIQHIQSLRLLSLDNNPLQPSGEQWGTQELELHFGDRVCI